MTCSIERYSKKISFKHLRIRDSNGTQWSRMDGTHA